jgi:ABC-2 type transport system ATP-binding protein
VSSNPMILAHDVRKSYGSVAALDGVDLSVPTGSVLAMLGRNGAGKTTFVRIVSTLLAPDAGTVRVAGVDVVRDAPAVRSVIGLAGQFAAVDEMLTGRENLELVGRLYGLGRRQAKRRADEVLEQLRLTDAAGRLVKTYSGGMRRRLDLGASLTARPPVLLLDEPSTGLDPRSRAELWGLIEELVNDGTTLLLTTQYLEEADRLADRVAVVERGKVIAEGTSHELKRRVGGDVLEVRASRPGDLDRLATVLGEIGPDRPVTDIRAQRVSVPAPKGVKSVTDAAQRIEEAGIPIADLGVRGPSLDDVFLALTAVGSDHSPHGALARLRPPREAAA